jgi:hypothetical protein
MREGGAGALMTYRISNRATQQVLGEWRASSFTNAAHQMCRELWGVNFDTALASGFVSLGNLAFTAKTY